MKRNEKFLGCTDAVFGGQQSDKVSGLLYSAGLCPSVQKGLSARLELEIGQGGRVERP